MGGADEDHMHTGIKVGRRRTCQRERSTVGNLLLSGGLLLLGRLIHETASSCGGARGLQASPGYPRIFVQQIGPERSATN